MPPKQPRKKEPRKKKEEPEPAPPKDPIPPPAGGGGGGAGGESMKPGADGGEANFDPDTGAIQREIRVFGQHGADGAKKKKPRGYGFTPAEDDHPFLKPQLMVVAGPTGSGKTIVGLNVLDEILAHIDPKRLGKVWVFTGSPSDPAIQSLDTDVCKIFCEDTTTSLIDELHAHEVEMRGVDEDKRPLSILFLDDVAGNKTLSPVQVKGSEIAPALVSHRHLGLVVIMLVQRVKGAVSPFILANFSHLFMFPQKSRPDTLELLRNVPFPEDLVLKHLNSIRASPHQFLWLDVPHRSVKLGFGETLIS